MIDVADLTIFFCTYFEGKVSWFCNFYDQVCSILIELCERQHLYLTLSPSPPPKKIYHDIINNKTPMTRQGIPRNYHIHDWISTPNLYVCV